ncbi:MAG TPA: DUF1844 domain-containing protein [Candidatus Methylomirabilis sp.]|nr:DUF1844 domain-containing protein [Candidatus Methylomirabilis sp.]
MAETDEGTFKVTDRRGRAREELEEPPPAESREPAAGPAPAEPGPTTAPGPRQLDLQGIFVMFATSALIGLGDAADPVTHERRFDLEQAREAIDILLMLRDKTAGNRTAHEDRLLEELVYDLQMRFVRASEAHRGR